MLDTAPIPRGLQTDLWTDGSVTERGKNFKIFFSLLLNANVALFHRFISDGNLIGEMS